MRLCFDRLPCQQNAVLSGESALSSLQIAGLLHWVTPFGRIDRIAGIPRKGAAWYANPVNKVISTEKAPAAIGPYSQAIEANGTLYCSGQIALDPATGELLNADIKQETEQVLKNLGAVLDAAGYAYEHVVKTTVFLADMADYATVNEIYGKYFNEAKPARAAVAVKTLPKNVRVEIDCVAVK